MTGPVGRDRDLSLSGERRLDEDLGGLAGFSSAC